MPNITSAKKALRKSESRRLKNLAEKKNMKKTGLKKFVDYILCADQINSPKPDPLILRLIMRKFNVKKN